MLGLIAAAEGGSESAAALLAMAAGGGGPTRGPGAAQLTYGNEPPELRDQFRAGALPAGGLDDLQQSGLIGLSATAPTVEALAGQAGTGAFGTDGAQTSFGRRVAPRHRDAVREFFQANGARPSAPSSTSSTEQSDDR